MRRIALIGVAALSFAGPALADRPATPAESRAVLDAARHLTAVGVPTAAPPVVVSDSGCSTRDAYACTNIEPESSIVLTTRAARDATWYARVVAYDTVRGRIASLTRCGGCRDAMTTAIHELVHVHRLPSWQTLGWDSDTEEGLAEAVAADQLCPFERHVIGALVLDPGPDTPPGVPSYAPRARPACSEYDYTYAPQVDAMRARSARVVGGSWWSPAARSWRLRMIQP